MRRFFYFYIMMFPLLLWGNVVTIATAANVSYAMADLKKAFLRTHPRDALRIIIGSSGKLTAQIRNGAPYDLFLSADLAYPQSLYREKLALTPPKVYARGTLALLSGRERDFSRGLDLLKDPAIRRIAIPNPRTAPYGIAAMQALKKSGLYPGIKSKLIYGESVAQTVSYTLTAADIGIVAGSVLYAKTMQKYQKGHHWLPLDPSLYEPIRQGAVLLKHGAKNPDAAAFFRFLLSEEAAKIFQRYGYLRP